MDLKDYAFNKTDEFEVHDSYDFRRYFKNEAIIGVCAYFGGNLLGLESISLGGALLCADVGFRIFTGGLIKPVSGLVGKIREIGSK